MEATITKNFTLDEPIDKVWASLSNPIEISSCVPGATITEKIDDHNYKGEVALKLGPVKAKYNGVITIDEMDDQDHKMTLKGKGLDTKGKGNAEMKMNGVAKDVDGNTNVDFQMVVTIQGTLAQFGSRLINDVSAKLMDQFVENFENLLKGQEFNNDLRAGAVVGSAVKGIFKKKDA